ncbi:hypothetical protein [Paradevosia shaoguanensis]|uniref:Uncharacterized protein n=1 Tax=Paradevosia shaoguanensis TaxID=1335043 RepID=A0AA41QRP2_9HYPH|nr:hypothetical protein [Paradevosia shaoguanensis]MCF1744840.1 hypothetical protein [Paradevosia shaoguanensis]MCI0129323.1 hypothetical protein [Paradevosia shaoguanensis]
MVPALDQISKVSVFPRGVSWKGKSGRAYGLVVERFDNFALVPGKLYVIASGSLVLWVGSIDDVINDQQSRARFRLAMDCADRVCSLAAPDDEVARMTVIWDLEGAEPATLSAA